MKKLINVIEEKAKEELTQYILEDELETLKKINHEKNSIELDFEFKSRHKTHYTLNNYKKDDSLGFFLAPVFVFVLILSIIAIIFSLSSGDGIKIHILSVGISVFVVSILSIIAYSVGIYNNTNKTNRKIWNINRLEEDLIQSTNSRSLSHFSFDVLNDPEKSLKPFIEKFLDQNIGSDILKEVKNNFSENSIRKMLKDNNNNGISYRNVVNELNDYFSEKKHEFMFEKIINT